jgi:hypothetical protein
LPICITRTCSLTARSKKGPPSAWCFRKATHSSCPAYLQRPLNDAFRVGPTASSFPWKGVRVGISALGAFWSPPHRVWSAQEGIGLAMPTGTA